ncbi:MAG: metal-dependent hydrolase [Candidatus Omnitrophica bacterium]|nr:metal-dependent hydrolase [Candidatus Omnitrophota bacterium]
MPSPVGHSIAGWLLGRRELKSAEGRRRFWLLWVWIVFAANAADLDFLPGIYAGQFKLYHHGMTHSLAWAAAFGAVSALVFKRCWGWSLKRGFMLCSFLYGSHILLDLFGIDSDYPRGMQLFWPFSDVYVMSPIAFFPGLANASLAAVFSLGNLKKIAVECLYMILLVLAAYRAQIAQLFRVSRSASTIKEGV